MVLGLLGKTSEIAVAGWDYNELREGLRYASDVKVTRFDAGKASQVAERLSGSGEALFSFEIFFKPNQNSFPVSQYKQEFDRVIDFASTYGGALISLWGTQIPWAFCVNKEGSDATGVKKIRGCEKSQLRRVTRKNEIVKYASSKGLTLDYIAV
jgi:hypothetical protein